MPRPPVPNLLDLISAIKPRHRAKRKPEGGNRHGMPNPDAFGRWVKERRRAAGMTRAELGEAIFCAAQTIWFAERGGVSLAFVEHLGAFFGRQDEALLVAGYAPDGLREAILADVAPLALDEDLRAALADAATLDDEDRATLDAFLHAACAGVKAMREVAA